MGTVTASRPDLRASLRRSGDALPRASIIGERVWHVHLKDVDPAVLDELMAGTFSGLGHAVREGLFTELRAGVLDLDGVIEALIERDYDGWLMVEQDSWGPPSESAAIGRRVLAATLRRLDDRSPKARPEDGR